MFQTWQVQGLERILNWSLCVTHVGSVIELDTIISNVGETLELNLAEIFFEGLFKI